MENNWTFEYSKQQQEQLLWNYDTDWLTIVIRVDLSPPQCMKKGLGWGGGRG